MRYFTIHNKHWIGDRLKHTPNINTEDLLCRNCGVPNSLPHLLYHCNHIKPLWNTVTDTFNEITRIVPDELKIKIQKQDFFFGVNMPAKASQAKKLQLHLFDILIGKMQLAIFSCHFLQQSHNKTKQSNAILQIWKNNMSKSTNLIISASNKKRLLHIWKFRGHSKYEHTDQTQWKTTMTKIFGSNDCWQETAKERIN